MDHAEQIEEQAMQLILHGGDGKSLAMEAMAEAKEERFEYAYQKIQECETALNKAHAIQTSLIQQEANGNGKTNVNLLMVHAQDHLMNAMTTKDLAREIIHLQEKLAQKGDK